MQVKLTTDPTPRKRAGKRESASSETVSDSADRSPFLKILDEVIPVQGEETHDLHRLWSQLPAMERDLLNNPSDENMKAYRETVRSIAARTLEQNVRLRKIHRKTRTGETVELNTIEVIDDRLHRMALMMQSRNNSAFALLKQIDEIRGLLLDMKE